MSHSTKSTRRGSKKSTSNAKKRRQVLLVASGDLRLSANQTCWDAQTKLEEGLRRAVEAEGYALVRAHDYDPQKQHGFIDSQKLGMEIFSRLDPEAPLIVAEAVWQYSHHVLAGLISHRGPILTVANWSGAWPGLVGMLNLNGSLTKAGVPYSTIWSEDFSDDFFRDYLRQWLNKGKAKHARGAVTRWDAAQASLRERDLGKKLARQLREKKAILGVFDEGCMGMFNAIIPDHLLNPTGVYKERLSQSTLYYESTQVSDAEAKAVRRWYDNRGITFHTGPSEAEDLTDGQILQQCKMYIAAVRLADDFGCDVVGIQYQQGLKDLLPASDLVEGTLNNVDRPPVKTRDGKRIIRDGRAIPCFNEVDECAGLDALLTARVQAELGQPVETTLHDLRWGDPDPTGTVKDFVWVFEISGSVPPAHFERGWADAHSYRQPPMYFRLGGGTLSGVCKPGEIVWSRIYIERGKLKMDLGRGAAVKLPEQETRRRLEATTPQWPIQHAITYGVSRDQMMARHKANHLNVVYATNAAAADKALRVRAAMADALGINVTLCGTRKNGKAW